jgi:BirA family biotin operon repressor/biotin-[acetyl-CoA-carboxylase] ligase
MVVVADYQSAGRGTHGRTWQAPPGTCLMFTLVCRPWILPAQLETLPRRVSESIAGALRERLGLPCEVKQPNDILVHGRKLCGVLCTSHLVGERVVWVLVGVGLNTSMRGDELPLSSATSLAVEGVPTPGHAALLELLLECLTWLLTE